MSARPAADGGLIGWARGRHAIMRDGPATVLLAPLRVLLIILVALVMVGILSTAYMVTSNALTQLATPS